MMMIMTMMMMMMVMMMTVMMMMMTTKNAIEYGDGIDDAMQREDDACRCRRTEREKWRGRVGPTGHIEGQETQRTNG